MPLTEANLDVSLAAHSIQYETSPPGNTKIPALDSYIHSVTTHIHPSPDASLNRGDVLEIQGPAASGKTQLLYHLLITCIMPPHHRSSDLGGWDETAILLDTDGIFDIHRFRQLLVSRLTRMLTSQKSTESVDARGGTLAEELASQCLLNLHVFRPTSSLQLAATLLHLPTYHSNNSHMQASRIGLLAIDSMSAFYWKDRFTVEQVRDAAHGGNASKLTDASSLNPMRHVLTALNKFRISHGPVIVMTNWGLNPLRKPLPTGEPSSPFYKQHLYPFPSPFEVSHPTAAQSANINPEKAYPRPSNHSSPPPSHAFVGFDPSRADIFLTYHITLHPLFINSFPATFTLAEAKKDEPLRAELVEKGKVQGLVRTPGNPKVGEFSF
ncbi:DNA repair protein XRCC2 [Grifola frondosa]|uniref:DNA repair protein XRCC2 n=1 Tax=Grifola frondosa TaxID=5627 RepID=A0A1C7MUD7_GRIFR|nr:DNA repair protein XRCC2 [Grifola frondosa]